MQKTLFNTVLTGQPWQVTPPRPVSGRRVGLAIAPSNSRRKGLVCHSSHFDKVGTAATKEKSQAKERSPEPAGSSDEDSSDDEEFLAMLQSVPPAAVTAGVNVVEALFVMSLATLLGDFLSVNPWAPFTTDWSACVLALQTSIPFVACLAVLGLAQTGVPQPTRQRLNMMSEAEDEVTLSTQLVVDLDFLSGSPGRERATQAPVAATKAPLQSGLQVFKWWVTKPWFFQFNTADMVLITASSATKLAASELMARGLVAGVLANWLHDAVANADSSSVLFWGKVFKLSGPELYRWFGVVLVAVGSVWAVLQESDRMRQWARLVLFRLAKEATEPSGSSSSSSSSEAASAHSTGSSSSSSTAASISQQAGAAVLTAAATSAAMSATGSVASSAAAAAAATTMSTAAAAALEGASAAASAGATATAKSDARKQSASSSSSSGSGATGGSGFTGGAAFMKPGASGGSSKAGLDTAAAAAAASSQAGADSSANGGAGGVGGQAGGQQQGQEPPVGLAFTGDNLKGASQIAIARNGQGKFEVSVSNDVPVTQMLPTQEDRLVYGLAAAFGTAQVAQLAFLYGTTGSLTATFLARVALEVAGNTLVSTSARGGPPTYAAEGAK